MRIKNYRNLSEGVKQTIVFILICLSITFIVLILKIFNGALQTNDRGYLLMNAVRAEDTTEVKELLASGVDPNYVMDDQTPLKLARTKGDKEIVFLLQKFGAKK